MCDHKPCPTHLLEIRALPARVKRFAGAPPRALAILERLELPDPPRTGWFAQCK